MVDLPNNVDILLDDLRKLRGSISPRTSGSLDSFEVILEQRRRANNRFRRMSLLRLMDSQSHRQCLDPRDMVFALLGLAAEREALDNIADYTMSVGEVTLRLLHTSSERLDHHKRKKRSQEVYAVMVRRSQGVEYPRISSAVDNVRWAVRSDKSVRAVVKGVIVDTISDHKDIPIASIALSTNQPPPRTKSRDSSSSILARTPFGLLGRTHPNGDSLERGEDTR
ncbi:hypothetical protein PV04_01420 [Phialophora macrospora]|uniref:Uncharacterized protein n=1 Tax=Phialophora macrospora TaxID=1851006 RepID=A0A0D2FXS5_9EURO|nr:hypothetical protein PV04_01420 [Phialophora macrospora]